MINTLKKIISDKRENIEKYKKSHSIVDLQKKIS